MMRRLVTIGRTGSAAGDLSPPTVIELFISVTLANAWGPKKLLASRVLPGLELEAAVGGGVHVAQDVAPATDVDLLDRPSNARRRRTEISPPRGITPRSIWMRARFSDGLRVAKPTCSQVIGDNRDLRRDRLGGGEGHVLVLRQGVVQAERRGMSVFDGLVHDGTRRLC
jgi:hypothetical protein